MEEFIKKYGGQGSQPYDAVELMGDKVHKILQKVERGDHNVIGELQELSTMLDEFSMYAKEGGFKPRQGQGSFQGQPYQNYQGQQGQPQSVYDPYRTVGKAGYGSTDNHWGWGYPNYPFVYPYYNVDRPGKDIGDRIGYRPNDEQYWDEKYLNPRDEYGRDTDGRDGRTQYPNQYPSQYPNKRR